MKAADLKKSILQYAVEGKLVPQDIHDEPASLLYDKIIKEKETLIKQGKIKKEKPLPPITDDEIPYNIPENWKWVRLGEVYNYGTCTSFEYHKIPNNTWILELEDIESGTGTINKYIYTPQRKPKSAKNLFNKNDILYSKLRPYLNKVLIANNTGFCSSEIVPIQPNIFINSLYTVLFFKNPFFLNYANKCSYGVKMPRLGTTSAKLALFPLPPLKEQERIVKKVDVLMALCDKLEQEEEKLLALDKHFADTLPKSILQYAVEGKLIPQDIHDEPASILYDKIIKEKETLIKQGKIKKEKPLPPITDDEIPYDIPKNWKWVRLGEVGYTQTGTTPAIEKHIYQGDYIPFIKPADISNFSINYDNEKLSEIGKQYSRVIEKNSILMVCIGGSIGKCFFNIVDVCCNQQINTLTPFKHINLKYILYTMQSSYFSSILRKNAGGTATPIINKSKWEILYFPLPPLKEQERIVEKVDELLTYCNKLKDII